MAARPASLPCVPGLPGTLGFGDADALSASVGGADVGEEQVLNAGGHGAYGEVRLGRSLHLDEAVCEVGVELDGAGEVVERVQVVWRVFGQELDVIKVLAAADELGQRRPRALQPRAERRQPVAEQRTQSILCHRRLRYHQASFP